MPKVEAHFQIYRCKACKRTFAALWEKPTGRLQCPEGCHIESDGEGSAHPVDAVQEIGGKVVKKLFEIWRDSRG